MFVVKYTKFFCLFIMQSKAPKYVLTALDETDDKDKQIARLQAMNDEKEKVAKKAMDEKEKLEAQSEDETKTAVKAIIAAYENDGREIPVVKAKLQAMYDDEKDESKKAVIKAAMDVFDEGNGEQVDNKTQVGETQNEPATKVIEAAVAKAILPFQQKEIKPIIAKILKANQIGGASPDQLKELTKSLVAKTYDEVMEHYENNKVLIASTLQKEQIESGTQALIASVEDNIPFNGENVFALTGNNISIDDTLENVTL